VSSKQLVLAELGAPTLVEISDADAAAITAAAGVWRAALRLKRPPLFVERTDAGWHLGSEGVAGIVMCGGLSIEIVPKFLTPIARERAAWRRALWHILLIASDSAPAEFEPLSADETDTWSLPDLMATEFLRSLEIGAMRGLPRAYRPVEQVLPVLRGSLDYGTWAQQGLPSWQLPCRFDELSEDIAVNRLLRWAGQQMRTTVSSPRLALRLGETTSTFSGVSSRPPALAEAEKLTLGAMHLALAPALRIALLLLRARTLEHGDGGDALPGFLWEGERVFEAFALRVVQQAALRLGLRAEKRKLALADPVGKGSPLGTTPDIRIQGPAGSIEMLDAKYKRGRGKPSAADVYQVLAAGKVTDCADVGLVFPLELDDDPTDLTWTVRGLGEPSRLWALGLDLTAMADKEGQRTLVTSVETHLQKVLATSRAQAAAVSPSSFGSESGAIGTSTTTAGVSNS